MIKINTNVNDEKMKIIQKSDGLYISFFYHMIKTHT